MNELLLFVTAAICTALVLFAWRFAQVRMYGVITLFLILIATVGGKIALFFGHPTNTGNIFYAASFLATYFMIERYGARYSLQATWISVIGVAFYIVFVGITTALIGTDSTASFNGALSTVSGNMSRVGIASLISFLLSQHLNVALYETLRHRWGRRFVWLRANLSNVIAQLLDSAIFFMIAFWGVIPPAGIEEVLVTGFVIKVVYMMAAAFFLYLNKMEEREDDEGATLLVWHP